MHDTVLIKYVRGRQILDSRGIPTVEVHISDINAREEFRHHSFISLVAKKTICGHGLDGYIEAIEFLLENF